MENATKLFENRFRVLICYSLVGQHLITILPFLPHSLILQYCCLISKNHNSEKFSDGKRQFIEYTCCTEINAHEMRYMFSLFVVRIELENWQFGSQFRLIEFNSIDASVDIKSVQ